VTASLIRQRRLMDAMEWFNEKLKASISKRIEMMADEENWQKQINRIERELREMAGEREDK
jgi:hypothetical protein